MAPIDQVVNVSISAQTTAVAQESFSIPLIMGSTANGWSDFVHTYTSPAGMLTDGYTTSSPEYLYALAMFSQPLAPTEFKVGKRGAVVAQVDTLAVNTLTSGHAYSVTVNGSVYSYTAGGGDTQQAVLTALSAAIAAAQPITGAVTGSGSGALLTLTSSEAGEPVVYTAVDSKLTYVNVTPATGIVSDLTSVLAEDPSWYGLVIASATDNDILEAAQWVEANKKFFVAMSTTSAIATTSTTDIGSKLKAAGYKRTALIFSPANGTSGPDAAWMGLMLPTTPGASNWAFKTLAGITADTLTANQISILIGNPEAGTPGKNVNIYTQLGGVKLTQMGTTASGQYIDITVGLDWLQSTIQTNVFANLVNLPKIPYTDAGVSVLQSAVKAALDQGVVNGLLDGASKPTVSAPPVATVPSNQRASRISPPISFQARLAGANNAVVVQGVVTV